MKALVTGAGGFVGANLVRHLMSVGIEPVAVVRPGAEPWRLAELAGEIAIVELDLEHATAIAHTVGDESPDLIFHLAAHGAYSWQSSLETMVRVNVLATEALLTAARAVGARLVCAGTSSEYGYKDHAPSEGEPLEPNSHYAVTKAAATQLCQLAAAEYGQHAVTLRLYSVYGPWEDPRRLMPTLITHALEGYWPVLVAPATARDFVWIDDVCAAFVSAATADLADPGSVFNIASGTQTTLAQLVELVRELFSIEPEPVWGTMAQRGWDTTTWVGDAGAAAAALDWKPATSLASGIACVADWLTQRPSAVERHLA